MGLSSDAICVNELGPSRAPAYGVFYDAYADKRRSGHHAEHSTNHTWEAIRTLTTIHPTGTPSPKNLTFQPQLAPVGEALLEALAARPGDKILDIASCTGEPALTLARRQPHVDIIGIDAAAGMVRAAQNKVKAEGLGNITFHTMPAEHLAFDRILCRFGVMLFETRCEAAAKCIAY